VFTPIIPKKLSITQIRRNLFSPSGVKWFVWRCAKLYWGLRPSRWLAATWVPDDGKFDVIQFFKSLLGIPPAYEGGLMRMIRSLQGIAFGLVLAFAPLMARAEDPSTTFVGVLAIASLWG
jgi:hypothetical protein